MMINRAVNWLAAAAMCGAVIAEAQAQGAARIAGPATQVSRQLIEQKESLVKSFLGDSQTVGKIAASDKAEARSRLAGARDRHARAVTAMSRGDLAGADRLLDEATRLFGEARRLVAEESVRQAELKARYTQTLESVEALRESYRRHLNRIGESSALATSLRGQFARASVLSERAKTLFASGKMPQAIDALGRAEKALLAGFSRVLGSRRIEYSQRFETPAEEFAFELDRNRSYEALIPIAIAEFRPASAAIREVQRSIDANHRLLEEAVAHATQNNYAVALKSVRSGTAQLHNALAVAGLRVPEDQKAN